MADITLVRPAAQSRQSVSSSADDRFVFAFPTEDATLAREGDNLVLRFEDGAALELTGFYNAHSKDNMPDFVVDGVQISGEDFFMAMNEPDLMPAAGPGAGAAARSARYNEYGTSDLADGISHLEELDWGMTFAQERTFDDNAWGRDQGVVDYGVNIISGENESLEPDTPVVPVPGGSTPPAGLNVPQDILKVQEADLAASNGSDTASDSVFISTPDGLASITVAGRSVYAHGSFTGGSFPLTDEATGDPLGTLTITGFNAATGELRYSFELTGNTLEHSKGNGEEAAWRFPLVATDNDGDTGHAYITVVVEDDVPVVTVGSDTGHQKTTVTLGADSDLGTDLPTQVVAIQNGQAVQWEGNGTDLNGLPENTPWKSADGTLVVSRKGDSYEFALVEENGAFKTSRATITVQATDADGDMDSQTVQLTAPVITPGNTTPDPSDPDPANPDNPDQPGGDQGASPSVPSNTIIVDEGALHDGTGQHAGHGMQGRGSFTVDLNGEAGSITVGGYTYTVNADGTYETGGNQFLTVNGVTVSMGDLERGSDDQWTVNYTYALASSQKHDEPSKTGADDVLKDSIPISVTDLSGDTATSSLKVEVHDDGPMLSLLESISVKTSDSEVSAGKSTATVMSSSVKSFGADGAATETAETYHLDITNATTIYALADDGKTYQKVTLSYAPDTKNKVIGTIPEAEQPAFTLEVDDHGDIKLTQYRAIQQSGTAESVDLTGITLSSTLTDRDGDTITDTTNITLTFQDSGVTFGDITVTVTAPENLTSSTKVKFTESSFEYSDAFGDKKLPVIHRSSGNSIEKEETNDVTDNFEKENISFTVGEITYALNDADNLETAIADMLAARMGSDGATSNITLEDVVNQLTLTTSTNNELGQFLITEYGDEYSLGVGNSPTDISAGRKTQSWDEEIGYDMNQHTSEAVVIDMPEGELAYNMSISIDRAYKNSSEVEVMLFLFYRKGTGEGATDILVGHSLLSSNEGSGNLSWDGVDLFCPSAFNRVAVATMHMGYLPGTMKQPDPRENNSDFSISSVQFNTFVPELLRVLEGESPANSVDGIADYAFATEVYEKLGYTVTENTLNADQIQLTVARDEETQFTAVLNPQTGSWTYYQQVAEAPNLYITARDNDGESATLWVDPNSPADDLIYGVLSDDGRAESAVYGSFADDTLDGNDADNTLFGEYGDDDLSGGAGDDILFGGGGDDYLSGGDGKDMLFGGSGNDIIVFDGDDYMIHGGSGIDVMVTGEAGITLDSLLNGEGSSTVKDVEVLIKGGDALSLTSMDELSEKYGISISEDGQHVSIDSKIWHSETEQGNTTTYTATENPNLTLEVATKVLETETGGN